MTRDEVYEREVSRAGLYGQAFFGWDATPQERRILRGLWRKARRIAQQLDRQETDR